MNVRKVERPDGNVTVFVEYLYDDHGRSTLELFELDIKIACHMIDQHCMGATIKRAEMVENYGSRKRKLKFPQFIGQSFSFTCSRADSEMFNETVFALMR